MEIGCRSLATIIGLKTNRNEFVGMNKHKSPNSLSTITVTSMNVVIIHFTMPIVGRILAHQPWEKRDRRVQNRIVSAENGSEKDNKTVTKITTKKKEARESRRIFGLGRPWEFSQFLFAVRDRFGHPCLMVVPNPCLSSSLIEMSVEDH